MNILIVGSGGREHALAFACAKDVSVKTVFVAKGNAGTALDNKITNIDIDNSDFDAIAQFCDANDISFVIIGPEAPLVTGIVDFLRARNIKVWGPVADCARLEGSKDFAKTFMQQYDIPTASYQSFTDATAAINYIKSQGAPIVIKADGLAAGKGVVVAQTIDEAVSTVNDMLSGNKFGGAGERVVIEEFLDGEEASFICMIDGQNILPMATSQDHKRIFEKDLGDNTGGMGAYSPAPIVTDAVADKIIHTIIRPVVNAMQQNGTPYTGFLYAGLMIKDGMPKVIEFNCRFGDPETQPIMMRLQSSLVDLVQQGLEGALPTTALWDERPCLGVVLASKGYPQTTKTGDVITGLDKVDAPDDAQIKVFHAGTTHDEHGNILTAGGRVLCVTVLADSLKNAQAIANKNADIIDFSGKQYRKDIGHRAIERGL